MPCAKKSPRQFKTTASQIMITAPVICFGQQPCGFFPKRFLVAKIQTARRLQAELGGEIVFFYHDSDHDPRETRMLLRHRKTGGLAQLNFAFENRLQRKFSPLYLKRIPAGWQDKTALQLPNYVERLGIEVFKRTAAANVADFCLEMYRGLGLLEGIRVARSSDPAFRREACDVAEFFLDVSYEGEIVRARFNAGAPVSDPARIGSTTQKHAGTEAGAPMLTLHEGGDSFITLPATPTFTKEQISPTRDTRLRWMQSVLRCTHYIAGAGEKAYLRPEETPEVTFIKRDAIDHSDEAWTEVNS
jgi:hypothetical protein